MYGHEIKNNKVLCKAMGFEMRYYDASKPGTHVYHDSSGVRTRILE